MDEEADFYNFACQRIFQIFLDKIFCWWPNHVFSNAKSDNGRDSNRAQNVPKTYLDGINKNVHLRRKWSSVD